MNLSLVIISIAELKNNIIANQKRKKRKTCDVIKIPEIYKNSIILYLQVNTQF